MSRKLTEHGKCCMQNNQLPTKSHVELELSLIICFSMCFHHVLVVPLECFRRNPNLDNPDQVMDLRSYCQLLQVLKRLQSGTKEKESWATELPKHGMGLAVIGRMQELKDQDKDWQGRCSGAVYIGGAESEGHFRLVHEAYCMFAHTNPLHPDVFLSIPHFEAELVAMTAAMLCSKLQASGGQICGITTSGGTESILMAVKSTCDFMRAT